MNIGLVLSGGMAKGAYQIGALKALNEFIPLEEIKYMSCASIGVLNGYAYATGKTERAEDMWKNACCDNARLFVSHVLKSSMLQQSIKTLCDKDDHLNSVFYCTLLDAVHLNVVYKNLLKERKEKIPLYLKASVAMPVYNRAVELNKVSYFDGAMVDNIPVFPLLKHKLDYIICIYFDDVCYKFENTYFDNKIIKITFPCNTLIKQSLTVNQESIEHMITDGYNRTVDILNSILHNGYEDIEYIYKAIECKNLNETHSLRITGDVLVTNINKVTQKFAKRKILV